MAFGYVKKTTARAKATPGVSYEAKGKKPKLGTGKRFSALKTSLSKRGAKTPGALAAWIGHKKYGSAKMTQMAVKRRLAKK